MLNINYMYSFLFKGSDVWDKNNENPLIIAILSADKKYVKYYIDVEKYLVNVSMLQFIWTE